MEALPAGVWISLCAERLRQQWRTVALEQLEDVAHALWQDERWRREPPGDAAEGWLRLGGLDGRRRAG